MAIFLWLWNLVSPIVVAMGMLYVFTGTPDTLVFVLGGIASALGLIIGIVGWGDMVPPRWFWIKSRTDLAGSRIGTAISYAIQFFFIPAFVIGLIEYFG